MATKQPRKDVVPSQGGQPAQTPEMIQALLTEAKAKKLELLEQANRYHNAHQLERFVPHTKQQLFFDALQDPSLKAFVLLAGNRYGKTTAAVAAAISLAIGRYPWVPQPPSVQLPQPTSLQMHSDNTFTVAYPAEVHKQIEEALLPAALHGRINHAAECKQFLMGWRPLAVGDPKKPKQQQVLLARTFQNQKELKTFTQLCAAPPDPGKLRWNPPIKIRVLAEDMTALEQVQLPKFRQYVAPEWVAAKKKNSFGIEAHWIFQNGSVIDFLTYQQDPAMMEGWDGYVTLYDEPPPRPVYVANLRGLVDHSGISIFSMTPLKEPWIADEIVNKADPTIWTITAASRENPHLKSADIDSFESALTPDERETRMQGKFLHLQGLVFKDFKPAIHVVPCQEPPRDSTVYAAIDTHPRTEQALTFMWVDRRGNQFVCHEIFRHGSPEQVADWVIDFHKTIHPIEQAIIDPSSQGDTNRGKSTFEVIEEKLADHGISLDFGSKDLSSGIQLMQDAFKSRNGVPSLFIDPHCTRLIWELGRYVWKDWKAGGAKDKGELNKPKDADDHLIEDVRRLIQLPAEYRSPRSVQDFQQQNRYQPSDDLAGY